MKNSNNNKRIANENKWSNVIPYDSLADQEFKDLQKIFHTRYVYLSNQNSFKKEFEFTNSSTISSQSGISLSIDEINQFSDFTIETFYKKFPEHHTQGDIELFKKEQPVAFGLPFHFQRHFINHELVAYLVLVYLEKHPYFQKPIWHIGYCGMSENVKDRNQRNQIKDEWRNFLHELNLVTNISGVVDYYNSPSQKMFADFNVEIDAVRLNPKMAKNGE
ncbi:MAG: hypothetical protein ACXVCR_01300 [Bdellovibrio sp.]